MGICGSAAPNCTLYKSGKDPWVFEADPDIAGIGVLSAFVATSFITLCLSLARTVITLHDDNKGYWIDVIFGKICEVGLKAAFKERLTDRKRHEVKTVLEVVILNLSDQQILVGLAILLAGIIRVCSISAYHFTIVSDLGWFASNTHLLTLGVLQFHFRLPQHRVQRDWRVLLILLIFVFMVTYQILQANGAWYDSYSSAAKCLFDDLIGNFYGDPAIGMDVNLFFLLTSYPKAIVSLFETASGMYEDRLYKKPGNFLSGQMTKTHENSGIVHHINEALWAIPWLLHHILVLYDDSIVIIWLFNAAWFGWGLQSVLDDRSPSPTDENELGFGQLVPRFLLVSTIFVAREVWDDKIHAKPMESKSSLSDKQEDDDGARVPGNHVTRHRQNDESPVISPRRVDTEQRIGTDPVPPANSLTLARRRTGTVELT